MRQGLTLTALLFLTNTAFAQDTHQHDHGAVQEEPAHDHNAMTTPTIDHSAHSAEPVDHSAHTIAPVDHSAHMPAASAADTEAPMAMDHSAMSMGIDTPPENARDPHAYSSGFTHGEGPYAFQGSNPLMLADEHHFMSLLADRIEYTPDTKTGNYELQAWRGNSFNRLVLKTEGSFSEEDEYENQTELLWSHALDAFWDTQVGLRVDTNKEGKSRQWLAAGIQGLAPYWFELDTTAYVGTGGQTELVFDSEYELLLTQRLVLQPRFEFMLRGKDDSVNYLGSGLSEASASLRLRYEFSRQFAPFIGVESERLFGNTAKFKELVGEQRSETHYFAGVRFWF